MSRQMKVPLNLLPVPTDPANGSMGDMYYNTVSGAIRFFNGAQWLTLITTEPAPFYLHTHDYDGDVVEAVQIDGGTPSSTYNNPITPILGAISGGEPGTVYNAYPINYNVPEMLDGGDSEDVQSGIIYGGDSEE